MIKEIVVKNEFFNPTDTLECGQIFRYFKKENGYLVLSKDKACFLAVDGQNTVISCNEEDVEYFYNYFDLSTDYEGIFIRAQGYCFDFLKRASMLGKGVRILRQDPEEMLFSFMISQNNNIPRIKKSVNQICEKIGKKHTFLGYEYFTFPSSEDLANQSENFFKECGLGYRAGYIKVASEYVLNGGINQLLKLEKSEIKSQLLKIKGVGEKVADCVLLFGFYKTDSFPVDTWIEKIYHQDFGGEETNRNKICDYFVNLFGADSGYIQQYLFYYKRTLEKSQN